MSREGLQERESAAEGVGLPPVGVESPRLACGRAVETTRRAVLQAERIAVVSKFRFMGDTLVATPFLAQLRRYVPHARIALLASPSAVTAMTHCPYVDELLPLETRRVSRWHHSRELYALLRAGRYAAAFLLNRSLHCALMATLARIPARIGYATDLRRPLLAAAIPYGFDRHEACQHLDMLRILGFPAEDALPSLWIAPEEEERAQRLLREQGGANADEGRPLIGVQPGANDAPIRAWGAERYARVADTLADEIGGAIVIMGGAGEEAEGERMARALRHRPINLVGKLKLREALAVIGRCGLWLGNDTGLLHAAVAQRVASVGLFGPNKILRWGYDTPRHRSLVVFPERPAQDDATVRRCLDAISEEQVLETARAVYRASHIEPGGTAPSHNGNGRAAESPYFQVAPALKSLLPGRRR
jgi:heptosyltransferase-2